MTKSELKETLCLTIIIIVVIGFSPPPLLSSQDHLNPRVGLIGLDAADWDVINPLISAGKLPHLRKLIENGVRAPLKSIEPTISPALWTTIVTGKRREKHGILSFTVADKNGQKVPVTSNFRTAKALWNILSEQGRRVGFVNWWPSFPAERVNGFIISNYMRYYYPQLFVHGGEAKRPLMEIKHIAFPEDLDTFVKDTQIQEPEFFRMIELSKIEKHRLGGAYDPTFKVKFKDNIKIFKHAVREDEIVKKLAEKLLGVYRVDLFGVYFEGIDVLSHIFWKYSHPDEFRVDSGAAGDLGGIIDAYYEFSDRIVGELLQSFSPESDVIIVSDHGYGKVGRNKHFHRDTGIIILAGPSFKKGVQLTEASILDVTPTILYLLGLPVARDMEGKILTEAFTDGFRTKHTIRWIDTYEETGVKKEPAEAIITPLDDEIREKLKALGYIK